MKVLSRRARQNRRHRTPAELEFFKCLQRWGIRFASQRPIDWYIVDFLIVKKKLIVELDGSSHLGKKKYDDKRTKYLENLGYRLIRFPNSVVLESPEVIREKILSFSDIPIPRKWSKLYGKAKF